MPDREKVIKSIEDCVFHSHDCVDCDYDGCVFKHGDCRRDLLADALELLKDKDDLGTELTNAVELIHKKNERIEKLLREQEPIEPEIIIDGYVRYRCKCGAFLFKCGNYRWDYCPYCGKKMKWE